MWPLRRASKDWQTLPRAWAQLSTRCWHHVPGLPSVRSTFILLCLQFLSGLCICFQQGLQTLGLCWAFLTLVAILPPAGLSNICPLFLSVHMCVYTCTWVQCPCGAPWGWCRIPWSWSQAVWSFQAWVLGTELRSKKQQVLLTAELWHQLPYLHIL